MTDEQIALELKTRLNKEREPWGLHYEVPKNARPDGAWTQFYVKVDEVRATGRLASDHVGHHRRNRGESVIILVHGLMNAA